MRSLQLFAGIGENLRRTIQLVWRAGWKQVVASLFLDIFAVVATILQLAFAARLLRQLRQSADVGAAVNGLWPSVVVLAVGAAVVSAVSSVQQFLRPYAIELVTRYADSQVLASLRDKRLEEFDNSDFHDRLERLAKDSVNRPAELVWAVSSLITAVVGLLAIGAFVVRILPELLPLMLLAAIPLLIAGRVDARAHYQFSKGIAQLQRRTNYLRELLIDRRAAAELAGYGVRPALEARHDQLQLQRLARLRKLTQSRSLRSLFTATALAGLTGFALWLITRRTLSKSLTVDEAVAVVFAIQQLATRMNLLRYSLSTVQQNRLFLNDLYAFIANPEGADARQGPRFATPMRADERVTVDLKNVSFHYPNAERLAVSNVSLHVPPGRILALVGENGSGKTTLAKLIAGLYSPVAGQITVNDIALESKDPAERSAHAVTVFQDFVRYALTASENVSLGRPDLPADPQRIHEVVTASGLQTVIDTLPKGLDTTLAAQFEDGIDLSTGQWQRVALARAFYRNAPLLVLDEPTAALDARAEFELFERVRTLAEGRTVILISHRLASVRHADSIVVMRHGSVVEQGNHSELVALNGLYAELINLQEQAHLRSN
jgi:ATP-binding cassette, subfamily B, bacterial